jgi:REP element-mobilizing transposase RayT
MIDDRLIEENLHYYYYYYHKYHYYYTTTPKKKEEVVVGNVKDYRNCRRLLGTTLLKGEDISRW